MDATAIEELETKLNAARGIERLDTLNALAEALRSTDSSRAESLAREAAELAHKAAAGRRKEIEDTSRGSKTVPGQKDDPALALYRKSRAVSLGHIGYCLGQRGQTEEAEAVLREALTTFQTMAEEEGEAQIRYIQGCIEEIKGSYESALAHFHASRQLFQALNNPAEESGVLLMIGAMYLHQSEYHAALDAMIESLALARQAEHLDRQAHALTSLGVAYMDLNDYEKALDLLLQCEQLSSRVDNRNLEATNLNNLGSLHFDLRDYTKARQYYERSYTLRLALKDTRRQAVSLNGIGICLHRSGQYKEALDAFDRSLKLLEPAPIKSVQTVVFNNLGRAYENVEQFENARRYYQRSLELSEQIGDRQQMANSLHRIGMLHLSLQESGEAIAHFQRALKASAGVNIRNLALEIRVGLAKACGSSGQSKEAMEHYDAALKLKDELAKTESDDRLNKLRILHEVAQARQEREILRLRNEKLEQNLELQRKELTANALYLAQKNDLLRRVASDLRKALRPPALEIESRIRDMLRELDDSTGSEDSWLNFEEQFNSAHSDFVQTLSERYPRLTATERRVCALTRLNLSNKEISRIMNVAPRSIEVYRNRIRKKLSLPPDTKLPAFLLSLR